MLPNSTKVLGQACLCVPRDWFPKLPAKLLYWSADDYTPQVAGFLFSSGLRVVLNDPLQSCCRIERSMRISLSAYSIDCCK